MRKCASRFPKDTLQKPEPRRHALLKKGLMQARRAILAIDSRVTGTALNKAIHDGASAPAIPTPPQIARAVAGGDRL
jgi:hypothetical protein